MDLALALVELLLALARLAGSCFVLFGLWAWFTGRLVWKGKDRG